MKRKTKTQLDKKLWTIFSQYIRLRDSDESGFAQCITCDAIHHWKKMQAGHYISRGYKGVKYDEKNVHAQCFSCNMYWSGQADTYVQEIVKRYGQKALDELRHDKKWATPHDWNELNESIEHYTEQVKILLKTKS